MDEILTRAKKVAEQAEVFQVSSRRTPVHFEANRLKQIETKESTSLALRIMKGGRIGFSAAAGSIEPDALLNHAVDTAQFGMPARFDFPNPKAYPHIETFDPETEKVTIDNMVTLGERLIATVRELAPDILCDTSVTKGTISIRIANSQGGEASYDKSFFSLSLEGILIRDGDMLFVGDSQSSCHPLLDFKTIADEVTWQLDLAKREAAVSTGTMPIIFTPRGVASALIAPLILAFNGKMALDGASPLKDAQGKQLFDRKFSLWDNPLLPYQPASRPCDDEGVPSQQNSLIDNGVVSQFLYDLQTAALANTQSTGSGNRHGGLPSPSPSSLIIDEGDVSLEEMIKNMKHGLVIDQLIGAEQGNLFSGAFSGNVLLGYKVDEGEVVGRVKDTMVSGNIYQILKQLEAVGQEARWIGSFLRTPCLLCSGLSVATKTG